MNPRDPAIPQATYQDVIDAPAHRVAEILDGRLYVSPRPPPLAALAKTHLKFVLMAAFDSGRDGPGGWWIWHEPELHFGEDVLVPDVVGWRRERMPTIPTTDYVTLAPDWACEVLTPKTRELDLGTKRPVYAREGVAHLWLIDPANRTLEAFEFRDGEWDLIASAVRSFIPSKCRSSSRSASTGYLPRLRPSMTPSSRGFS